MSPVPAADNANPVYYKFIDRLLTRDETSARFLKNITCNEGCLAFSEQEGYFYPPILLLESLAQAAGELDACLQKQDPPRLTILIRMKNVQFKKLVKPGDQVVLTARFVQQWQNQTAYEVEAHVEEELASSACLYLIRV